MHRDQVGDRLAGVGDSDEQVVGLPGSHRRGVAHGEGEVGIAHQHRPLCMAGELNRAAGQPVEGGGDLELDRLGPLLQPFDGEVGLPAFGRLQLADVVGGAELAVFSGRQHRHGSGEVPIGSLGHAQGVIARIGVGAGGQILAGGQDDLRFDVADHQVGLARSAVGDEGHGAEVLVQKTDVAGYDHHPGDGGQLDAVVVRWLFELHHEGRNGKVFRQGGLGYLGDSDRWSAGESRSPAAAGCPRG